MPRPVLDRAANSEPGQSLGGLDAVALRTLIADAVRETLRAELLALLAPRPSRHGLVATIARTIRDKPFTARGLFDEADSVPALAAALSVGRLSTPRSLGQYLRRIEGRARDGFRIEAIGADMDGVICHKTVHISNSPIRRSVSLRTRVPRRSRTASRRRRPRAICTRT
jgi:hypothetical protein